MHPQVDGAQENRKSNRSRSRDNFRTNQKAVDLAHQRYEAGASDCLGVVDTERTLLEAQDRLAASQTQTATALVAVYKALGGGVPVSGAK
jgi:multidrug efflux system outer membrane protein